MNGLIRFGQPAARPWRPWSSRTALSARAEPASPLRGSGHPRIKNLQQQEPARQRHRSGDYDPADPLLRRWLAFPRPRWGHCKCRHRHCSGPV